MKILYVIGDPGGKLNENSPVGNTVHILSMIKAFRNLGCEVIPFLSGENAKEKQLNVSYAKTKKILSLPSTFVFKGIYKIFYNLKFYRSYKSHFQKIVPDLIYERHCIFHFACSLIAKKLKIPHIVEINSPVEAMKLYGYESRYLFSIAKFTYKYVTNQADAIVAVSQYLRSYLIDRGVSPEKIYVLPNGVDCELFNPENVRSNIRDRYNFNGKIIVGYVGSTSKYQRLDFLVKSAPRMINAVKNLHFLIVGPFEDIKSFKKLLEGKSLMKYFTLTGGVPHEKVPKYISAMDICVQVHSNPHGSPIKIFAYGAMSQAVIAPDFEPVKEVAIHGESILLFKPLDGEDFANSIIRLAKDPSLRKYLGNNLREHICKNHTWQRNAERTLEIHKSIRKRQENRRRRDDRIT